MKSITVTFCIMFFARVLNAQEINVTIQHESQPRTFIVYSPCQTYNCTGKQLPVVFVFHGLGQNPGQIRDYSLFNSIADTAGFVVVYPQGINNGWNVGFNVGGVSSADDVGFTEKMIQYLRDSLVNCATGICANIDTNRIYSTGMSNGGFMSYHLACNLSNRIKAIASVTGSMTEFTYDNCNPLKPIPVLEIHGDADALVSYNGSGLSGSKAIQDVLSYWNNNNGCPSSPTIYNFPDIDTSDNSTVTEYSYKPCDEGSEVLHYKVTGGGHCWIGSASAPAFGTTNMDVDASTKVWEFFRKHGTPAAMGISGKHSGVKVNVLPNPANNIINIEFPASAFAELKLLDISGKMHVEELVSSSETKHIIDVSRLGKGIYLLELTGAASAITTRVLVE